MTKEEKIQEAYNKLGIPFNENILYDNGWTKIKPNQFSSKYEDLDLLKLTNHVHSIRPKSLQGIEDNNGWIKIESEDDLPKEDLDYKVGTMVKGKFHYSSGFLCKNEVKYSYFEDKITHYQPIEKSKPPIY